MRILAIDTATASLSVAIVEGETVLSQVTLCRGETHSRHLMPTIETILAICGLEIDAIDGFAVTHGPGSFTGLRIGVSTVKGLAGATGKPVVGVSSLDALALQATGSTCLICSLIDARRQEVYYAHYRMKAGRLHTEIQARVGPIEEALPSAESECLFIGNGACTHIQLIKQKMGSQAHFASWAQNIIQAASVAQLGRAKFETDAGEDVASLAPNYIRKPDAETQKRVHSPQSASGGK